jgi:hypothetical protein
MTRRPCASTASRPSRPPRTASRTSTLARKLTARRTVLAGSNTATQLAAHYQAEVTFERDGEQWTRFLHAPDERTAVTVEFGCGASAMSATATIGQIADAIADALNLDDAPAAKHPIGFTAPPRTARTPCP